MNATAQMYLIVDGEALFRRRTTDASPIRNEVEAFVNEQIAHCHENESTVEVRATDIFPFTADVCLNGTSLKDQGGSYRFFVRTIYNDAIWRAISEPETQAQRDAEYYTQIYLGFYLPNASKSPDGTYSLKRDNHANTELYANYGEYLQYVVVDNLTDTVVACGCFQTPRD